MKRSPLAISLLLAALLALAIAGPFVQGGENAIAPRADANATPARGTPTDDAPTQPSSRQPVADRRIAAGSEPQMQVRVVDTDGNPVPAARVRYADHFVRADENPRAAHELLAGDPWRVLGERGGETTTDAEGIARWPWSDRGGSWHVAASTDDRFAIETLSATARPRVVHELRLAEARVLTLRLVDPFGRGVAGVLVARPAGGMSAHSEPSGTVEFRPVSARVAATTLQLRVYAGSGLPPIELDPDRLPRDPIVVQLPACGTLHLAVRDPFDRPIAWPRMLAVGVDGANGEEDDGPWCYTDATGEVHGLPVAIGRRFRVTDEHGRWLGTFDGPRHPGETVDAVLHEPMGRFITARLLLDGAPFARRNVTLDLFHAEARTDAEGHLCCREIGSKAELWLQDLTIRADAEDGGCYMARWRGNHRLVVGDNDFGMLDVVHVPPAPVLVSGHIECAIDDLADVFLAVSTADEDRDWARTVRTQVDHATGAFRVRAEDPGKPLRIRASHATMGNTELACTAGRTDLLVQLLGGTRVVASFADVTPDLARCLEFSLHPDGARDPYWHTPWERHLDGTRLELRWEDQQPGVYCLEVHVAGMPMPFLRIPALCVEEGQTCADPRLAAIRLPPLHVARLRIETREGVNWRTARFAFADGERSYPHNAENGEFVFALAGPVTFDLTIDGRDPIHVVDLFADRTLKPW